jgi:capsular polysaccharide transport system permease protein
MQQHLWARPLPRSTRMSSEPLELVGVIDRPNIGERMKVIVQPLARLNKLFTTFVLVPTALATLYYGFVAHDVFLSESHFVVRNQQHQSVGGIGSLLQGAGLSQGHDEAYSVQDFLSSRDALEILQKNFQLRNSFGQHGIDRISRFSGLSGDDSFEALLRYYRKHVVETDFDSTSSIMSLTVRAFDATEAHRINEALLEMSEDFVNRLNERARADLMRSSAVDVDEAEREAKKAVLAVSSYRNDRAVFDPEKQSQLQLAQVAKLQEELIATRNHVADVRAVAPENPQLPILRNRTRVLQLAIDAETGKVAGDRQSLSSKSAEYEGVALAQEFAAKRLELALASLQLARENALKQQLYIERIAQPNKPDEAVEPRRMRNILATFLMGLVLWGIASLIRTAVREHAQ